MISNLRELITVLQAIDAKYEQSPLVFLPGYNDTGIVQLGGVDEITIVRNASVKFDQEIIRRYELANQFSANKLSAPAVFFRFLSHEEEIQLAG